MSNEEKTNRYAQDGERMKPDENFTAYYHSPRRVYWSKNKKEKWIQRNTSQLRSYVRTLGYNGKTQKGDCCSEIDTFVADTDDNNAVDYVGALAGYQAGQHKDGEVDMLITSSPKIIQPANTEWDTLHKLLTGMFDDEQLYYLYGWLHFSYKSLVAGQRTQAQALAVAGKAGGGKSLFQNIITRILGGRSAKPYQFMTGGSAFNYDLFGAEHLMIEDETAMTDLRSRRNMGQLIKNFTVCSDQRCHAKGIDAIMLHPFWRLTITMNDEPENLMVLPPIDESLVDKIILLKAKKVKMPMPTDTIEQKAKFWDRLMDDLPGFINYLLAFEVRDDLKCDRFGIKHFHHPDIIREINALSPEIRLFDMIQAEIPQSLWEGSSMELEAKLTGHDSDHSYEARKLLSWGNSTGTYLKRLGLKFPDQFIFSRTHNGRIWKIYPRKQLVVEVEEPEKTEDEKVNDMFQTS